MQKTIDLIIQGQGLNQDILLFKLPMNQGKHSSFSFASLSLLRHLPSPWSVLAALFILLIKSLSHALKNKKKIRLCHNLPLKCTKIRSQKEISARLLHIFNNKFVLLLMQSFYQLQKYQQPSVFFEARDNGWLDGMVLRASFFIFSSIICANCFLSTQ